MDHVNDIKLDAQEQIKSQVSQVDIGTCSKSKFPFIYSLCRTLSSFYLDLLNEIPEILGRSDIGAIQRHNEAFVPFLVHNGCQILKTYLTKCKLRYKHLMHQHFI